MSLPQHFCWTRYGTEAGESIERILQRKEAERAANRGTFLWGIGSALGPSIEALLGVTKSPKVIFSPIKSAPRAVDVRPERVVRWQMGVSFRGESYRLPDHSVVTSRASSAARPHYALVCHSSEPLEMVASGDSIDFDAVSNLVSGRRLGASQVTAVVALNDSACERPRLYSVTMAVDLVAPYFVRLADPVTSSVDCERSEPR